MHDDDTDARLDALQGSGRYVTVLRAVGAAVGGVVEAAGESLVLMQALQGFHRRGFVVLRRSDVTAVREGDAERLFGRIVAAEGVDGELRAAPSIDLDGWWGCLRDLRRMGFALTLECEALDPPAFYLGRLEGVTRESAALRFITVEGVLERAALTVPLDDVTLAGFDDRYSTFFGRHAVDEGHH